VDLLDQIELLCDENNLKSDLQRYIVEELENLKLLFKDLQMKKEEVDKRLLLIDESEIKVLSKV
jgi:hypothetical protein